MRRLNPSAAALAMLFFVAAPAAAQDSGNPLKFLKPWLEKQIFGKDESQTEEPATGALPDATDNPEPTDAAAAPDASESPPHDADGDSALRGGSEANPEDAQPEVAEPEAPLEVPPQSAALPEAPADDAAMGEPGVGPPVPPAAEAGPPPLRFALLAGRSAAATLAIVGPIADDLGAQLDRSVEFLPFPSYGAMIDAQVERRIDGGFYSAPAFAMADARCRCLDPLVAPRAFDGTLAYHAIVVVRADSGIATPADLAGKTVAVGTPDSIGARRMQLAGLMAEGVDPQTFGSVVETDSPEAAVRLVADRRADAAFAWSSLAGRIEDGYSRGTLTELVAAGAVAMPDLAIVWKSPAIEHGPFAVMRALDEAAKDKIEAYLLALMSANPAAYDGLNPYYGGGYAPVDSRDYAGLDILAAQDVDAFKIENTAAEPEPAATASEPPPQ